MIYDRFENASLYYGISPSIKKALEFLQNTDLAALPEGRVEIDGDTVYANVSKGKSKPHSQAKMEAHRKYIDIQYNITAKEDILFKFIQMAKGILEEQPEKDLYFYDATGWPITVGTNRFAILFPTDLHAPGLTHQDLPENQCEYKKVVVKIKV